MAVFPGSSLISHSYREKTASKNSNPEIQDRELQLCTPGRLRYKYQAAVRGLNVKINKYGLTVRAACRARQLQ